ncbi:hypothetical protein [Desulfurobacterium sp.]
MKAIEIFKSYYPKLTESLESKLPDFLITADNVEVIPWQDDFAVADKNPEALDQIEFWNTLLDGGLITEEEWKKETDKIFKKYGYCSKTMGVAFIDERKVSFRKAIPDKFVLVHEIGHIHFAEIDLFWSASYGGGEILFWLALEHNYEINDAQIRRFMSMMRKAYEGNHLEVAEEIVKACHPLWGEQIVPAFYPICLGTGWMPSGITYEIDPFDLTNPDWLKVEPKKEDVLNFFQNLTAGLQYSDTFWINYSKRLGFLK